MKYGYVFANIVRKAAIFGIVAILFACVAPFFRMGQERNASMERAEKFCASIAIGEPFELEKTEALFKQSKYAVGSGAKNGRVFFQFRGNVFEHDNCTIDIENGKVVARWTEHFD